MHDIMEDYVYDVLSKSKTQEDHPKVLIKYLIDYWSNLNKDIFTCEFFNC